MDETSPMQQSLLLTLPPELRLQIYSHLCHDNHPYDLDILNYQDPLPSPSITQVSRKLRTETLQLYRVARIALGKDHRWIFTVDAAFSHKSTRELIRSKCLNIPASLSVLNGKLSVLFDFPCTPMGPRQSIRYDLGINAGMLTCQLDTTASPVSRYRTHVLESAVRLAILQLATRRPGGRTPSPRLKVEDPECLDVQSCLWPVFDLFDAIPFFSSLEFWEY